MVNQQVMTGNAQFMKQLNRSTILSVIRTQGPIPRAEIAKMTNLTPPTVTNIVGELIEEGLVIEGARGTSNGGRKPIMLELNPRAGYVLGVDIGSKRLAVIGVNLEAEIQVRVDKRLPDAIAMEDFLELLGETIEQAIQTIIKKTSFQREKLIGIGVGMHGIVDMDTGTAIFAPNIHLRDVPIADYLQQRFAAPVQVDNDVRAMAVGESWFGNARDVSHFICINVGYGIGAAIVLGKELYHGVTHSAGEIGHTTVDEDGTRCSCGNYGCLQAMAAGPAIASRAVKAIKMGADSLIQSLVEENLELVTGSTVYQAAEQGDELAIKILEDTGRYLGIAIANLVNILNPEKVIIGGGVANAGELLFKPLIETVAKRSLNLPYSRTKITHTALGDHATAIGAASMILKTMFSPQTAVTVQ